MEAVRGPELVRTAELNEKLGNSKLLTTTLPDGVAQRLAVLLPAVEEMQLVIVPGLAGVTSTDSVSPRSRHHWMK